MPWSESRQPACVKELVPLPQGLQEAIETVLDVDAALLAQPLDPGVEVRRRVDGHRPVGAKRGQHADGKRPIGRDRPVMFQRVGRIVGGADQHDVHLPHDAAGRRTRAGPAPRWLRRQMPSAVSGPSSRSLMPSGRFNSRCVQ